MIKNMDMKNDKYEFYKENENNQVWWVAHYIQLDENKELSEDNIDKIIGEQLFSFDKKKIYNLFTDYPHNLTKEEKEIFDKENPYWADFFKNSAKGR